MYLTTVGASLLIAVAGIFLMPKYTNFLIKRANQKLLERIRIESDSSLGGNLKIKKVLMSEGYSANDIGIATVAATLTRLHTTLRLAPIYAILACLYILTKILLHKFDIYNPLVGILMIVIFLYMGRYVYKERG